MDPESIVIAKITRGERVGDIAAYLHGPGKSNEHQYVKDGQRHSGGMVIASNIGAEGATDPAQWAADVRHTQQQRPDITKPIWQASLRVAPGDRVMDDQEWADIASRFMDDMGVGEHPWVAVRHGKDHIHVVVSRVNDTGEVWHGRNDRRQAQSACTRIEKQHDLEHAPRRRTQQKKTITQQRQEHREAAAVTPEQRRLRRRVNQLTPAQWEALDPEVQQVMRINSRERVPGAHIRPKDDIPQAKKPKRSTAAPDDSRTSYWERTNPHTPSRNDQGYGR